MARPPYLIGYWYYYPSALYQPHSSREIITAVKNDCLAGKQMKTKPGRQTVSTITSNRSTRYIEGKSSSGMTEPNGGERR